MTESNTVECQIDRLKIANFVAVLQCKTHEVYWSRLEGLVCPFEGLPPA